MPGFSIYLDVGVDKDWSGPRFRLNLSEALSEGWRNEVLPNSGDA